ncbi:WhiB family transcriptional regulator [Kribbella sp. ALI-6-A]|uniref:WhiB family transcriptional regulator n=1 Tax=Kribbella sp. ALI-6-A TaxID=1933817 RepID=UPI00097BD68C|nr:WhiB family transcriptional regulator [Kribbella sp. ALI-6-A]ONI74542.1 WhiB family transcriptional regulator [Kribbella sp. ALI-6-A]
MRWLQRAACRSEDPGLFFPIGSAAPSLRQIEDAKTVCRRCEVADACLDWALRTGQDAGVWGGLTEDERRTLRRNDRSHPRRTAEKRDQELPL